MATTATTTAPEATTAPATGFRPYLLTYERYARMVEAGIFSAKDPVFLWKGQLVEKMTQGAPHNNSSAGIIAAMIRLVPEGWHVRPEQPLQIGNSAPEPDLQVVRGAIRDYPDRCPTPRDVSLVVEVADSSLRMDAGEVLETFAAAAIPVYWIVNIPGRRIEVHGRPTGPKKKPSYLERREYGPDDEVPVVLDGREVGRIAAKEILI